MRGFAGAALSAIFAVAATFAPGEARALATYDVVHTSTLSWVATGGGSEVVSGVLGVTFDETTASGTGTAFTDATSSSGAGFFSVTSTASGSAGAPGGSAESDIQTGSTVTFDNSAGSTAVTFVFDVELDYTITLTGADPFSSDGGLLVGALELFGTFDVPFEEVVFEETAGVFADTVTFDDAFSIEVGAGDTLEIELWVDAFGGADAPSTVIPLPAALPMMAFGVMALGAAGWRRRARA